MFRFHQVCSRNDFGLTTDVLLALDRETLYAPDSHAQLRERYHISEADWQEIRRRLLRIAQDRVDSKTEAPSGEILFKSAEDETLALPSPPGSGE